MRSALPDETVTRFQEDLIDCEGGALDLRTGICVSGGPDSIALLLLAHAALPHIEAATVDHGLRPESGAEAAFVAEVCAKLGVRHAVLKLAGPPVSNVQAWARDQRYAALVQWAGDRELKLLLTAHHADDQLETMIMRLNRGSGVAGLAGIRAARDGLSRPLLGWRKAELEAIVHAAGISAVDDPSNRDDRFDRARLRKMLDCADWLDPVTASKSAAALADAEEALGWAAQMYAYRKVVADGDALVFDPALLPREFVRRIVIDCLARINPGQRPRGAEVERLIAALWEGRTATLAGVRVSPDRVWRFAAAPPRRKN